MQNADRGLRNVKAAAESGSLSLNSAFRDPQSTFLIP
jgi:hypothetical protein